MTDYNRSGSGDLTVYDNSGNAQTLTPTGTTLGVATYYIPLGSNQSTTPAETNLQAVHLKWALALAATITVETCNFPSTLGGGPQGGPDITDWSSSAGDWIQENPSTAYVGIVGSGNTVASLTITAGGTAAGGCMIHLGNLGSRRCRLKVVTTVGGLLRVSVRGKNAA